MSTEAPKHKMKNMSMEALTHHSAAELPFSLIESEILSRIMSKSDIGRCRCVCKQWKSFLSTSTFATMHLRNHTTINDYKLLILDDAQPPASDVFILASLDGLVCLASRELLVPTKLMFWNPLTGVHKKLPPVPKTSVFPCDSIGFYKDSSNDYKLLYFVTKGYSGTYIYSHRLNSWREIGFPFGKDNTYGWSATTFWGQCLYFTVKGYSDHSWNIICFNVETETFRKISCPRPIQGHTIDYSGSLVILNGCIHLCVSYKILGINHRRRKQGELWRMDGNVGWVKVAALSDPFLSYEKVRRHICMTSFDNWIVVLDHENKDLKKVKMGHFTTGFPHFRPPGWEDISRRVIYVESLVSPLNP